jgi:multiple sugar transport system substrate-binding protein
VNDFMQDYNRISRRKLLKAGGLGAAAIAAAPIVAACSSSSSSPAASAAATAAASAAASGAPAASASAAASAAASQGATGTITIGSFQDPAMKPFREVFVPQFQQETGIKVVYEETSYDAFYQKAKQDGLNKTGAYDIYVMDDNWVPEFAAGGIIQSLDKLGLQVNPDIIAKGLDQGYWPPRSGPRLSAFKDATPELYALVIIDDVNLLYYNTDYFTAVPDTWDAIESVITAKTKAPDLYGFAVRGAKGNPAVMTYLPFLFSYGGKFVNDDWSAGVNSPEAIAALTRELTWTQYMPSAVASFDTDQMTGLLLQGKCMAITDYTGTAVTAIDNPSSSKVVGKIDLATTPKQVVNGPAIGTFICGISSGAQNTPAAVQFLEWFTSDKIQLQFAQGGSAAVTQKALTDPSSAGKYRWLPAIAESVANAFPKPRTPDEPKFEDILGTQINIALTQAVDQKSGYDAIAKQVLDTAAAGINDVIQKNKSLYF